MDKLLVEGGQRLHGEVVVSGAKNAALPILCASLLSAEPLVLTNVPRLNDVNTMERLLTQMGVAVDARTPGAVTLDARRIDWPLAPYELVKTMRASILALGPLLARCGEARVSLPGGCAIGLRPVDQHVKGLEAMGATIDLEHGYINATGRLRGATVVFDMATVTGTENLLMAATLAEGTTTLENAAREPEIVDLARCLTAMGARISGAGSDRITVEGVAALHGATHADHAGPDRDWDVPRRGGGHGRRRRRARRAGRFARGRARQAARGGRPHRLGRDRSTKMSGDTLRVRRDGPIRPSVCAPRRIPDSRPTCRRSSWRWPRSRRAHRSSPRRSSRTG